MREGVNPQVLYLKRFRKIQGSQSMVSTLAEVKISLRFQVGHDLFLVDSLVTGTEKVDSLQQANHCLPKCFSGHWNVVDPCKQVPRVQMVEYGVTFASAFQRWKI